MKCNSCKKNISNQAGTAKFMCPKCGKFEILRCANCRQTVAKYVCPGCGFIGPN